MTTDDTTALLKRFDELSGMFWVCLNIIPITLSLGSVKQLVFQYPPPKRVPAVPVPPFLRSFSNTIPKAKPIPKPKVSGNWFWNNKSFVCFPIKLFPLYFPLFIIYYHIIKIYLILY